MESKSKGEAKIGVLSGGGVTWTAEDGVWVAPKEAGLTCAGKLYSVAKSAEVDVGETVL